MATSSICMRLNVVCYPSNAHIFTYYECSSFGFKTLDLLRMDGCITERSQRKIMGVVVGIHGSEPWKGRSSRLWSLLFRSFVSPPCHHVTSPTNDGPGDDDDEWGEPHVGMFFYMRLRVFSLLIVYLQFDYVCERTRRWPWPATHQLHQAKQVREGWSWQGIDMGRVSR